MSDILQALYTGNRDEAERLAEASELNVFEAAALGRAERVQELVEEDPSRANSFGDDGFQPLGLACFFGHLDAARVLLDHGADPNTLGRNEHIQTNALHAAAAGENKDEATRYELCALLLERGADPSIPQGTNDFRAIDAARMNGDERLEQLLNEKS